MYKVIINNRDYTDYSFVNSHSFEKVCVDVDPVKNKMFNNDQFDFDVNTQHVTIKHSMIKSNMNIAGVLDFTKTYGKIKKKYLYRCNTDDKRLPTFLIPYEPKYNFDKSISKLYITFKFDHWNDTHPHGQISQMIGDISILNNFYEYLLYTRSLNCSIQKFTKDTIKKISNRSNNEIIDEVTKKYDIECRNVKDGYRIFTIDNDHSNDHDDAISWNNETNTLSIYITNVALVIDYLELWDSFSTRIETMYLPDRKRPMLPNILSECLCSLNEGTNKLCYVLDIHVDQDVTKHSVSICNAEIWKNYAYKDNLTDKNVPYLSKIKRFLRADSNMDVVHKSMLYMNHYMSKFLMKHQTGIFKNLHQNKSDDIPSSLPKNVSHFIQVMRNNASSYVLHDQQEYVSLKHPNFDSYVQATSPIRRLVDLLNNICILDIQTNINSTFSCNFYDSWVSRLDFINISSRAIRKIQYKCQILNEHEKNRIKYPNKIYHGYVFDRYEKSQDNKYQYMVYIPSIKLSCSITVKDFLENFTEQRFQLYIFHHEQTFKKKIKLQLV
jgi:hypothetical protein